MRLHLPPVAALFALIAGSPPALPFPPGEGPPSPAAVEAAAGELQAALPPDPALAISEEERNLEGAAADIAVGRFRLMAARIRILTEGGQPIPGVTVRALLESLDLSAGPVVTDASGWAPLRLPAGTWRIDAATEDPRAARVVFLSTRTEVPGPGPVEIRTGPARLLHFVASTGPTASPDGVTLALPDFSFSRAYRCPLGRLEVRTADTEPLVCQAVRAPDDLPGYVLRGELPAEGAALDTAPRGATRFILAGAAGRRLTLDLSATDALPLALSISASARRSLLLQGFSSVAASLTVDRGGKSWSFYRRPFELDGGERLFTGEPPFEVSVGVQHNTSALYKGRKGTLSARVFLREANGLVLSGDSQKAAFEVELQELLDGKVRAQATLRTWYLLRTPVIEAKDIPRLEYRLHLRGPGDNRGLKVAAHGMTEEVRSGSVVLHCHPEVAPNAALWARYVEKLGAAHEQVCTVRNKRTRVSLFSEMPPGLAGYGGFRGSEAFAYIPESRVFGFIARTTWDKVVGHEITHGFHYGHGEVMKRASSRAARRLRALLPGMDRVPEGNRFLPFLEAVTAGRIDASPDFADPAEESEEEESDPEGEDDHGGDSGADEEPEFPDDDLFAWYVRSRYGVEKTDQMLRHRPTYAWWLVTRGFSDAEIRGALLSHVTGEPHAWLARLRGLPARDARVAAAAAELAAPAGGFTWAEGRSRIAKRWASPDFREEKDLDGVVARMLAELGVRERRVEVLLAVAKEHLRRGTPGEGKKTLLLALVEARRGDGESWKDTLAATGEIWAARGK